MFARWKFQIALIAVIAVFTALAGGFRDEPLAYAQQEDGDYVDVGLFLEVPIKEQASFSHDLNIIVVNNGSRTAYDVEVVVDVVFPDPSGFRYLPEVPVGSASLEGTSLHWTIPALAGLRREEVTALVIHEAISPNTPVYDNEFDPHELFGRVTTASFESDRHKGNNTSRVWSYSYRITHSGYRQVNGNYYVNVSVDERHPAPGGAVNFTVTAARTATPDPEGTSTAPPIELQVKIELTDGLTVDGTPSYHSSKGGTTLPTPASVTYSNGVFDIGTQKSSERTNIVDRRVPTRYSVTLPVTVASGAVVSEQCLTATLTGKPPPGTGPLGDDIADNVAKLCLGSLDPYFTSADLEEFVSHPCVGNSDHPCDSTDDVRVRATDTTVDPPVALAPGTPVILVPDTSETRKFDSDTNSVNAGTKVSWQVPVQISYRPYTSEYVRWTDVTDSFSYEMPGKDNFDKLHIRTTWARSLLNDGQRQAAFLATYDPGETPAANGPFLLTAEFEKLGTYKVNYAITATHDNNTPSDTNDDVGYPATGSYIFHVGPIADLGVSDGGASPHVTAGSNALTIVAYNNELETSWDAQVTGLPTGAEVIHVSQGAYNSTDGEWDIGELRPRGYYSSRGEPEPTLVLSAAAGDTADVSIAISETYKVCIGRSQIAGTSPVEYEGLTLAHTTQSACEAATGGSWHTGPVYDYNADNNMATVTAKLGTGGGDSAPASVTVMDPDASGVLVEWKEVKKVNGLDVKNYELQRSTSTPGTWTSLATVTTTDVMVTEESGQPKKLTYQDKGATGSENPVYRVRAVNEAGVEGPWSQTSGMRPGAPQNFAAAVASGNAQVNLTWSAPAGVTGITVTGYEIEVSADGGETWASLATSHSASPYPHTVSLMPGDSRDYRIRTVATVGSVTQKSLWATATAEVAYPKPDVPKDFTATGQSATQAELSWGEPADVANVTRTGYELGFSTDGGSMWNPLTDTSTKSGTTHTMDHTDGDLRADAVRQYRIRTTGTVGSVTVYSNWVYALASEEYPAPGAPRNFMATVDSDTSVTLTWTDPEAVADVTLTGYVLEVSFDRGATWSSVATESTLGASATTHTHTDASNPLSSKPRQYRLKAKGNVGASTYESGWVFAIPPGEVGPPRNLYAAHDPESPAASKTRINLTWDEPAFGADRVTGYRIDHASAASGPWTTLQHSRASRSYQHTGRDPGQRNCYRVAAIFAGGTGPFADSACATTLGAPADDLPGAPESLRIESVGSNYVTLEWDAPSLGGAVDYYEYRSNIHDETRVPGVATRVTVRGLQPGTSYEFQVRAVNNIGEGGWSRPIQFTLNRAGGAVKATPTELEVPKGGTGSFRVSLNRNPRWPLALYTHWEGPDCLTDWLPYQQGRILLPSGNPPPGKAFWDDGWWGPPDDRFAEPWNVGHDIELDASECQGGETAVVEYSLHSLPFSALEGVPMWEDLGLNEEEWREKWGVDPMDGISGPSVKVTVVDGAGSGRTSAGEQGLASVNAGGTAVNVSVNLPPPATVWRREERGLYGSQLAWDWWD